jgi:biopolymer transport protein ExbB/TolQ
MGTMLGWFQEGGPIMLVIALVGLVGISVLVERLYVIVFRSKNNGRVFIERIIQLVRGGKLDDAIKQCANSSAALPDIGLLILRSRSRNEGDLQNVAAAASLSVVPKLTRRLQYLPTLAAVAILLGVLGSVHGFRDALLRSGTGTDHDAQLTAGFAAALTPTAFGLAVGVVLTLGRGYLVSQAEAITEQIREFSARLINALSDRPDVRLGHR